MKSKTKRLARRALSWLLTTSIILGIMSIGGFTIYAAELAGYENETVVRFKNAGSGKYLNVHNGIDANGTNVYQWTYDGSDEQMFRIKYNREKDCYTIGPMCCNNGYGRVLDIVKSGNDVVAGCNVQIYSPVDAEAQEWQFEYYGGGAFAIHPVANIYAFLTAYNNLNGTANGIFDTSPGNVYLTEHPMSSFAEPASYQLWFIEEVENKRTIADGYYNLKNNYGNKYMTGNVPLCGVYQASGRDVMAQIWHVEYLFNGYYSIRSAEDAKYALSMNYANDDEYEEMGIYLTLYGLNSSQSMVLNYSLMWKIIPNAEENNYRIVAKRSYDNQVVTAMSDENNGTLYAQVPYVDADTQKWTFVTPACPGSSFPHHAAEHLVVVNTETTNHVWYGCALCDASFMSPQEQDYNNFSMSYEDRASIYALQNAALLLLIDDEAHLSEACLRAVDVIRSKYDGRYSYDFSDKHGNYVSPIAYTFDADNIGARIDITTDVYDYMRELTLQMTWGIGEQLPFPFNAISSVMLEVGDPSATYTFMELVDIFLYASCMEDINNYLDASNLEIINTIAESISYVNTGRAIRNTLIGNTTFETDVGVSILIYDKNKRYTIGGLYRVDNTSQHRMNILETTYHRNNHTVSQLQSNLLTFKYSDSLTLEYENLFPI